MERYVRALSRVWDVERIRSRAFRLVVDYSYSPAAFSLPSILGRLGAEVLALRAFSEPNRPVLPAEELSANIAEVGRMVGVMEADLGVVISPAAERLYVIDDRGREVPVETALLLFVRLMAQQARRGALIALPLTVTRLAERLAAPFGVKVVRTEVSLPALAQASTEDGVVFAGMLGGGYIFPEFLPAFDAIMSLGKLLELLAPQAGPLSASLDEIPKSTLVHRTVGCPWTLKGTVMRATTEELQQRVEAGEEAGELSLIDGIQVHRGEEWMQLLPDADEPLFHVYAEGADREASERMATELVGTVRGLIGENGG
jgi:mannose-1-phosphate guanylyltransferase / phosphomannomutase